jgi:hypothetical protein
MRIGKYSSKTNKCDLSPTAKEYLVSIGRREGVQVGDLEMWYRREGNRTVAVGPTRESVELPAEATK